MRDTPQGLKVIEWDSSLSVGIQEIDVHHNVLIKLHNKLVKDLSDPATFLGGKNFSDILLTLEDYAKTHFAYEEKLFKQYGYPEAASHEVEHKMFFEKVQGFRARSKELQFSVACEIAHFIQDWILHHILVVDAKYCKFFVAKGVS
jgi:hemerythrin-like metal-binding protein